MVPHELPWYIVVCQEIGMQKEHKWNNEKNLLFLIFFAFFVIFFCVRNKYFGDFFHFSMKSEMV